MLAGCEMAVEIKFGHENFANYKRLSYKWWFALAEFVDNSTQSFFDNEDALGDALKAEQERFSVVISTGQDFVRVSDNAMGMALGDLERAMVVGVPPGNSSGRSRYGLGMKTAACWIGDKWKIVTTKLGDPTEYTIELDVNEVVKGNVSPPMSQRPISPGKHYTWIEVSKHHRPMRGRTIGKVKQYLGSIYRFDIASGSMVLRYNDEELEWKGFSSDDFLEGKDGSVHKDGYIFEIDTDPKKVVEGWVGVLRDGSRSKAGFSILHRKRLIKGWPESWRPETVFGPGGRNDLINQRVVGEVNLEDFEIPTGRWRARRVAGVAGRGGPAGLHADAGFRARGTGDRAGDRGAARGAHPGTDQGQLPAHVCDVGRVGLGPRRGAQLAGGALAAHTHRVLGAALDRGLHPASATAAVPACEAGLPDHPPDAPATRRSGAAQL